MSELNFVVMWRINYGENKMSTQVDGMVIDRILDEQGGDVSNDDSWSGHEFTIKFKGGSEIELTKGNGDINMRIKHKDEMIKNT